MVQLVVETVAEVIARIQKVDAEQEAERGLLRARILRCDCGEDHTGGANGQGHWRYSAGTYRCGCCGVSIPKATLKRLTD